LAELGKSYFYRHAAARGTIAAVVTAAPTDQSWPATLRLP
jgi:hypothetical protein